MSNCTLKNKIAIIVFSKNANVLIVEKKTAMELDFV